MPFQNPPHDCPLCPRLANFRVENRARYPGRHNAPVPAFGALSASLLIVGLAPGLKGANFTGRPFTGDYAGDLLYKTLLQNGLAEGSYQARGDDGLTLKDCRITNAVRCVPPQNKPTPAETATCLTFLKQEISAMPDLKIILALGAVAHQAVLKAYDLKAGAYKFAHHAVNNIGSITLYDSYHCSRYNTQTGRLTEKMFGDVIKDIQSRMQRRP